MATTHDQLITYAFDELESAIPHIPIEVITDILARLPVKSLLRFKCVCKDWYDLISSSLFEHLHLDMALETGSHLSHRVFTYGNFLYFVNDVNEYPYQLTKLDIMDPGDDAIIFGSCNGLVCLRVIMYDEDSACLIICNPSTRTFKYIPYAPEFKAWEYGCYLTHGFGYDSRNDDYIIVVTRLQREREVLVYSMKADAWSWVSQPPTKGTIGFKNRCGLFGHNMLHYLVYDEYECRIARFDISSRRWKDELRVPAACYKAVDHIELGIFDGYLYLHVHCKDYLKGSSSSWTMKEYGVEESWTKMCHLPDDILGRNPGIYVAEQVVYNKDTYEQLYAPRSQVECCIASLVYIPGSSEFIEEETDEDEGWVESIKYIVIERTKYIVIFLCVYVFFRSYLGKFLNCFL